jgi:hypothetical protein
MSVIEFVERIFVLRVLEQLSLEQKKPLALAYSVCSAPKTNN